MKRIISFVLIISMVFCITGCSNTKACSVSVKNENYSYSSDKPFKIGSWNEFDKDYLDKLNSKYKLDELVTNCDTDFEKIQAVTKWVSNLWQHDGSNTPEKNDPLYILDEVVEHGKKFRCVEYGTVIYGCLCALEIPARIIGLKTEDVETRESGAGHVATEAYLKDINKWIFIDGQWGAIPTLDGVPLNAVEFGQAISHPIEGKKLDVISFNSGYNMSQYFDWINEYLFYLDTGYFTKNPNEDLKVTHIMLTPINAKNPTIFQINSKIQMDTYTHSVVDFYPVP